ncbi:hypothetical protein G5I_03202 [Acromyrmex echinatior]|uniref:TWiK family of potassium channels protein 18 n=1 Tax=Acromyrmex echinatior TaxID=103372 RepID=F4WCC8_ACREC|nr:hypothetical protein G5I_03202 [Acromyrmex echinatior]
MEKDNVRHYRAYEGFKPANNGNTSSLKRSTSDRSKTHPSRQVRCLCFGGVPDKASQHSFLKGFIINIGICSLLVAYTLLGSFIFLAIESGTIDGVGLQQRTLATTIAGNQHTRRNTSAWIKQEQTVPAAPALDLSSRLRFHSAFLPEVTSVNPKSIELSLNHEARTKTVENIWIITEHLNVLYRENWTKLADQEIARFQEQLVKRITEDMMATQNAGTYTGSSTSETVTERRVPEYEWNFAKAFLYSLTVLTTIGVSYHNLLHNCDLPQHYTDDFLRPPSSATGSIMEQFPTGEWHRKLICSGEVRSHLAWN